MVIFCPAKRHFRCFLKEVLMLQRKPEQFSSQKVQDAVSDVKSIRSDPKPLF